MKTKKDTNSKASGVAKLSISLPKEMTTWLRRSVARKPGATMSQEIRAALMPLYEARHSK